MKIKTTQFVCFLGTRRASEDPTNNAGASNDGWDTSATPYGVKRRNKKRKE